MSTQDATPPLSAPHCSATGVRVEMKDLRRVMAYLAIVESVPLEEVTWLESGEPIAVRKEELAEWKFTGLNNRDFALILLEGRKAQNSADQQQK